MTKLNSLEEKIKEYLTKKDSVIYDMDILAHDIAEIFEKERLNIEFICALAIKPIAKDRIQEEEFPCYGCATELRNCYRICEPYKDYKRKQRAKSKVGILKDKDN